MDVAAIVDSYGRWLAISNVPKLFIDADPGAILVGAQREFCRKWPNQTETVVPGIHFIQEDAPDAIGAALRHGSSAAEGPIVEAATDGATLIRNMIRAAALDTDLFNQAERTPSMIWQALAVVVLGGGLAAVGAWIGYENTAGEDLWNGIRQWLGIGDFPIPTEGGVVVVVVVGVISAVVGWVVWAAATTFIGTRIFNGTTDVGEMLRVLGFAQAPRVIGVIPFLGPVAAVWVLVASVVAIREGLDFTTGRAVGTAIGGWLVWLILQQTASVLLTAIF